MLGLNSSVVIDCNSDQVTSINEIKEKIHNAAAKLPKGTWIKAAGYDQVKLKDKRHPTRDELDEAAPDHPVQLLRCCVHMGVYNSRALEIGEISPDRFQEGEVTLDESGNMTGLLKEGACTHMWEKVVYTDEEYMNALRTANKLLLSHGITSVHDAGFYGPKTMKYFQNAVDNDDIQVRIYAMLYDTNGKPKTKEWSECLIKSGIRTGIGNEKLKLGPIKILLDGSSSGPSSATKKPYCHNPELKGLQLWEQEEVDQLVKRVHESGFQMTAHAVGDAAVELILSALEKAIENKPIPHRHRIEHCAMIDERQLRRIKKIDIIPISNPGFFYENASAYVKYYGGRVNMMFALRSYLDEGIRTTIGSDAPVIDVNPMIGLYGAVMRKDKRTGEIAGDIQKINLLEAIRMYTINGAYAAMDEKIKGSIEEGKLADMIMLSRNIMDTPLEDLLAVKTDLTMVDGKIEYER